MKMKPLLIVMFAFSLPAVSNSSVSVSPLPCISVNNTVFDAFHAHRQHNSAALAWTTIEAGISSFVIQHSFDGVSFATVDQVSPEASGWNNYLHEGALPGYNYYRIGAILSNGTTEYSAVEVVRIVRRK
jgi:hypothetical protein